MFLNMKANNLTICIDAECARDCPYCVSKMTWSPKPNYTLFCTNILKALKMAELASVSSVLLTSKGEPLNSIYLVSYCLHKFKDFPLEIQTNGLLLTKNLIADFRSQGLNTLAISIDKYEDVAKFTDIYEYCSVLGINIRLTIVLSNLWTKKDGLEFLVECKQLGVKQITFRHVTIPDKVQETEACTKVISWIKKNVSEEAHKEFLDYFYRQQETKNLIRKLAFGASVYSMGGVSVTIFPYCIQESNSIEDIRSLIYHQDGHMYTSWDKPSSLLF